MSQNRDRSVAIVDDDPGVLESLKFLLEVVGYDVDTYASACAFLDGRVPGVVPACMILDHHMPRMTGLDLAEKLRGNGVNIPSLLITGSLSPAITARAALLGIEAVLEKPPREDELLRFIGMYI